MFFLYSKRKEIIGGSCVWNAQITYFHSSMSFLLTQKQKVSDKGNHCYYSPASSGGQRATEGGTCDASESEAGHTQDYRASA
jgi:hypothetical protein